MAIVDAHVHMGVPFRPAFGNAVGFPTDHVLRSMDRAGVDQAVIMGIPHVYDNDYTAKAAHEHPARLIPWAYVDPWHHPKPRESIDKLKDQGFVGIKLRPVSLRYTLADRRLIDPIVEAGIHHRLLISMHTGDDPSATPLQVEEMAHAFPEATFLMVHAGFRVLSHEAIRVARRCPNVYLDETAGTSLQLREALDAIGPNRIIYGSDSPFMDTRVELKRFRTVTNDESVLAATLGGNILRLLGRA
jgi:uncharacterized protein